MSTMILPEAGQPSANGDALYEVVNGIRVELRSMGIHSTLLGLELYTLLRSFVRERKLGWIVAEALFILRETPDLRRRPDVAFVSAQRWPLDRPIPEDGDWPVVPNLAVEVNSPRDTLKEVFAKLDEYFRHGVQQVWLVEPHSRKLCVYDSPTRVRILTEVDTLDNTIVPGFTLKVGDLFQQPTA
jgi:Uma2 family endonuclease